jgi:hypothetical protein
MGAFCTLVAAVYAGTAPLVFGMLRQRAVQPVASAEKPTPEKPILRIDYKPIRLLHQYQLGEVSRLWIGLPASASHSNHQSNEWYKTLVSAIQENKLKFRSKKSQASLV